MNLPKSSCRRYRYDYCTWKNKSTRSTVPVNLEAIKIIRDNVKTIPVIANGDCFTLDDCNRIAEFTGVDGVMSARGILANPALFTGLDKTPWSAVEMFMHLATAYGLPYKLAQYHVAHLLEDTIPKNT